MNASIRYVVFAAVAALLLGASSARAASFDCKQAPGHIERAICDDPTLNSLDSQLEAAFQGALDRSNHPAQVKDAQRAWLARRDACGDAKCLSAAYERQIAMLSNLSDEPAVCAGSTTPEIDQCQAEYARRADRELDRYVAAARKRLIDEAKDDVDPKPAKTALAGFDAAQATWAAFRKAECEAVYDWWSGGTIRGVMYQGCWRSADKARSADILETWLTFEDSTPPLMPKPSKN